MGIHDGHREKMRRRFLETGLEGFADHEALELLLISRLSSSAAGRERVGPIVCSAGNTVIINLSSQGSMAQRTGWPHSWDWKPWGRPSWAATIRAAAWESGSTSFSERPTRSNWSLARKLLLWKRIRPEGLQISRSSALSGNRVIFSSDVFATMGLLSASTAWAGRVIARKNRAQGDRLHNMYSYFMMQFDCLQEKIILPWGNGLFGLRTPAPLVYNRLEQL